jgi:uncharacterized protein (DUF3084 family)
MLELLRVFPMIAQVGGDLIIRQFDAPGMEALADRVASLIPAAQVDKQLPKDIDPEVRKFIAGMMMQLQQMKQQNQQLQMEKAAKVFGIEQREHAVSQREMLKEDAETDRLRMKLGVEKSTSSDEIHADLAMNDADNRTSMIETFATLKANKEIAHQKAQQHGVPNNNRPTNQQ